MDKLTRRQALRTLAAVPAAGLVWTEAEAEQAARQAQTARREAAANKKPYSPRFFSAHEFATLTLLANIIIPADERSGSASDAGVPEFIDFMMLDQPTRQVALRGGLRWLDSECHDRFGKTFLACTDVERQQIIDDIAWPAKARPDLSHGVVFFTAVRDLTATGFFTSKIGIEDLGYKGNVFVARWEGAPREALDHIGVNYAKIERWYER